MGTEASVCKTFILSIVSIHFLKLPFVILASGPSEHSSVLSGVLASSESAVGQIPGIADLTPGDFSICFAIIASWHYRRISLLSSRRLSLLYNSGSGYGLRSAAVGHHCGRQHCEDLELYYL